MMTSVFCLHKSGVPYGFPRGMRLRILLMRLRIFRILPRILLMRLRIFRILLRILRILLMRLRILLRILRIKARLGPMAR
jgi:hypothetical protein